MEDRQKLPRTLEARAEQKKAELEREKKLAKNARRKENKRLAKEAVRRCHQLIKYKIMFCADGSQQMRGDFISRMFIEMYLLLDCITSF